MFWYPRRSWYHRDKTTPTSWNRIQGKLFLNQILISSFSNYILSRFYILFMYRTDRVVDNLPRFYIKVSDLCIYSFKKISWKVINFDCFLILIYVDIWVLNQLSFYKNLKSPPFFLYIKSSRLTNWNIRFPSFICIFLFYF